jgi:serine/threonine-protein kinase RsbW
VIVLRVPGELRHRDVALRTVAAACKLVREQNGSAPATPRDAAKLDLTDEFDAQVVSAFSEAFNNIAIHAYAGKGGDVQIELEPRADRMTIHLREYGRSFDPEAVPAPKLDETPEGGLGMFIIHAFVDEFIYQPGQPNVWRMTKYVKRRRPAAGGD